MPIHRRALIVGMLLAWGTSVPASQTRTGTRSSWTDPSPHRARMIAVQRDVRLEVLDWGGRGTPLVFLAGYGNSAHVFDGFAPQFRDRYRVVGITRRGFGASSLALGGYDNATLARDVIAVLDSLRLRQPVLVGHSFGGAELTVIATGHPGVARALIYLDGGFDFAQLYADADWMNTPFPRPPALPHDDGSPAAATAYMTEFAGPGYPEAEVRAHASWSARVAAASAFHADSLSAWLTRGTPPARLREIRIPALAIYGVQTTVEQKYPWIGAVGPPLRRGAERRFAVEGPLLARQRARFRGEVRQASVVEIAGGRHYVFLTNGPEVARAIRQFAR